MLTVKQAKGWNKFSNIIAIIVAFSIFLPFILGMPDIPLKLVGFILLFLLIASLVIKGAVYKQAEDLDCAAQFWAFIFGGFAIGYFLFW